MFMITFENRKDIEKIYKITYVLSNKVEIAALKGSKLILQCKKAKHLDLHGYFMQKNQDVLNVQITVWSIRSLTSSDRQS